MTRKRYRKTILLLFAAVLLLSGCRDGLPMVSEVKTTKGYTAPETMIFVATERNRYEKVYGREIWEVRLDEEGTTFQGYLLGQVKEFLQEMKTMNLLAKQENIIIDSTEKTQLRKLAEEYYNSLTKEDIAYMGVDEDDAAAMYEEYYLANKVVDELTSGVDLEISDSEAKVIRIQQIRVSDANRAREVLDKLSAEGSDFLVVAKEYSEEQQIERGLGRGEETGSLEEAAFGLAAGEVSGVIAYGNGYYIVKCVDDYDEEATQVRKDELYLKRKEAAFNKIYARFKTENPVVFANDMWEKIVFSQSGKSTTTNFFELYDEYFPK